MEVIEEVLKEAQSIPSENRNFTCDIDAAVLDISEIAERIVDRWRGGICFEVDGLFAELPQKMVYHVNLLPTTICVFESRAY
jgi:arylamine N-acetyltransferase